MDKFGADKMLSVYWFVILFIVAGAVVYIAAIFYGAPYDVREIEADILVNKIADCISFGGYLRESVFDGEAFTINKDNFLEKCHLTFNAEDAHDWDKQEQFFINVSFYVFDATSESGLGVLRHHFVKGNINLKDSCILEGEGGKNFPVCVERRMYVLDEDSNQYAVKIKSAVRKTEKNVS